jgi:prepilin-type N-terminal cleavage/methylation domain-containing protein
MKQKQAGWTMIELLTVLAIVGILILIFSKSLGSPANKAKDARTKKNIFELNVAFEEYYNDNYCYPPSTWFDEADDCGSDQFSPYIDEIKCDPLTELPYHLEYDASGCDWYKIYTSLYFADEELCSKYDTGSGDYNYGISSSNIDVDLNCSIADPSSPVPSPSPSPGASPSPSVTPSPSPSPSPSAGPEGDYYCQSIGNCTWYNNVSWTCTPNYFTADCSGECAVRTGSCVLD